MGTNVGIQRLIGRVTSLCAPALVCLFLLAGTTGHCGDRAGLRADHPQPEPRQDSSAEFVGTANCLRCHRRHEADSGELDYSPDVLAFAGLDQSTIWETSDKHRLAVRSLFEDRGLRMIERLGLVPDDIERRSRDDPAYRNKLQKIVIQTRECLNCHANWLPGDPPPDETAALFGVHCETCHGAASKWYLPHSKPQWRRVAPAEKFEKFGMVDVRNPVTRVRQCLSCHIGNAAEGKLLTHDMYAAGHPPLPGIEIESYIDQMPRHWRDPMDKGEFAHRDEYLQLNGRRREDLARARSVLLSGIVALQHSVELLANRYASEQDEPDFATFNCADCHHDLRSKSWRKEGRQPGVRPGRPRPVIWPEVLASGAIAQACSTADELSNCQSELDALLEGLNRAVTSRPFGDGRAVRLQARRVCDFLDGILVAAASRPFDERSVRRSLDLLTSPHAGRRLDFDAARQIGWGTRIIAAEIAAGRRHEPAVRVDRFNPTSSTGVAPGSAALNLFSGTAKLEAMLLLQLPAGTSTSINPARPMRALYAYDPQTFREVLAVLHQELQQELGR